MKELNLGDNKIKLTLSGVTCELRYPTHKEALEYAKAKADANLDDIDANIEMVKKYMLSLGMSEEMFNKLTMSNMKEIHEVLEGGK